MIYTLSNKRREYSLCITEYIVIEQQEPRFNVCKTKFDFKDIIQLSINLILKGILYNK